MYLSWNVGFGVFVVVGFVIFFFWGERCVTVVFFGLLCVGVCLFVCSFVGFFVCFVWGFCLFVFFPSSDWFY